MSYDPSHELFYSSFFLVMTIVTDNNYFRNIMFPKALALKKTGVNPKRVCVPAERLELRI